MLTRTKPFLAGAVAAVALLATAGCEDWLTVNEPDVIDAGTVDPVTDAPTFALSAMNNLFDALDNTAVYQGWFTGEVWVGDTFTTRQDIAKRQIDISNGTVTTDLFQLQALAIASGERVQELLAGGANAATDINIARGAFASGYGIELMAETFCSVVISSGLDNLGSAMTPQAASLAAVERFQRVIDIVGSSSNAEAQSLATAARVGMARAYLQAGQYPQAIAAAQQVPAGFTFLAPRVDDAADRGARGALNNTVHNFTLARPSLVVPPYFRNLGDPRIQFELVMNGSVPAKTQGLDLDFYAQRKYPDYGADIRLASGLEARYIVAEAKFKQGDPSAALALIADRRVAGTAAGDDFATGDPTLVELLDQRARDFFLEAQHMGTWLRNPKATPYVLPAGSPVYYDPSITIGTQTCYPVPDDELDNNPNYSRGS